MKNGLPHAVTAYSWPALFITISLNRDTGPANDEPNADLAHNRRRTSIKPVRRRHTRITRADRAWLADQAAHTDVPARTGPADTKPANGLPMAVDPSAPLRSRRTRNPSDAHRDEETPWFELDLFPPRRGRTGSRFDDTVALPVDAPQRLDAIVRAADLRLRALPPVSELGHRTIAYRARLQQISRDAARARARLADGTYGECLTCAKSISLAVLMDRPWARQCTYCELDI